MVKELIQTTDSTTTLGESSILLYNDDFNTFDWVIQSLVDVCDHDYEQAEQCAVIVHTKGKYAVKSGYKSELKPRCSALIDRGLTAEVV